VEVQTHLVNAMAIIRQTKASTQGQQFLSEIISISNETTSESHIHTSQISPLG
jgi:hypothetical protein